jgi:hypothetical protein
MTAHISVSGILIMMFLYLIPALQVLLTISGQYRRYGLLLGSLPYLERWPVASDLAFALLFALPVVETINGDPVEALYYVPLYVLHQLLWLKRRRAKATQ